MVAVDRGLGRRIVVKLGLAAVLAPVALGGSGCHETYCGFLDALNRFNATESTCDDLYEYDSSGGSRPSVGLENATITWLGGAVVAGQPKEFITTSTFEEKDKPLVYYWEIDGDDDYDDVVLSGDAGHKLTLALPEGERVIKVKVANSIYGSATTPDRVAYGYSKFDVEPAPPGSAPPPTTPQPQNPPPQDPTTQSEPLDVAIALSPAPPESVDVDATVTKGGTRVSGARVEVRLQKRRSGRRGAHHRRRGLRDRPQRVSERPAHRDGHGPQGR